MKKILIMVLMAILMICCIFSASAISTDETINGDIQVISCDLTYSYSSGVSSDYYYTGPNGGSDAYYYVVSANGEIQLNISNVTADESSYQDYINKNFKGDLNKSLKDEDDIPIHITTGGWSDYPMSSYSIDGDILTIQFNGSQITRYNAKSDLCDEWDENNASVVISISDPDCPSYLIQNTLDDVNKVHS